MKYVIIALCMIFVSSGCASMIPSQQAALGADPVSVGEVFFISFDELLGCPLGIASHLEIDRPADACTPKAIPSYQAHIQSPRE